MWVIKVGQYYLNERAELVNDQKDAYKLVDKEEAGCLCDLTMNGRLVRIKKGSDES